jgi:hypothetical protein
MRDGRSLPRQWETAAVCASDCALHREAGAVLRAHVKRVVGRGEFQVEVRVDRIRSFGGVSATVAGRRSASGGGGTSVCWRWSLLAVIYPRPAFGRCRPGTRANWGHFRETSVLIILRPALAGPGPCEPCWLVAAPIESDRGEASPRIGHLLGEMRPRASHSTDWSQLLKTWTAGTS